MQLLTEKLKEHSVDYKIIEDDSRELQTISIFFPSSFKTLFVHIETDIHQQKGELHISFIDQPKAIDFYTIQLKDWDIFLKQMIIPGYFCPALNESVFDSWSSRRTEQLLIKNGLEEMYFMCIGQPDIWSYLNEEFMMNPFIRPVCDNEAGIEGNAWGSAQFKTAYSNSFINFEGFMRNDGQMLYFISCSYEPCDFGIEKLSHINILKKGESINPKMPIDLLLAIECFSFELHSKQGLINQIVQKNQDALFYTYVLLCYYGAELLLNELPQILSSKNQEIIEYLMAQYEHIKNDKVQIKFHELLKTV
jgi:hypothetical protein